MKMRAINLLILHILIFEFFQIIKTDHTKEPSFVASNQFDEPLVTKIKCHNRSSTDQEFTALIKRPPFYTTNPIIDNDLESRFSLFSNFKHSSFHCRFEYDSQTNYFYMKLTNFEKCGVSEMRSNDNKPHLSVSIRFAQLAGLRTKNDLNLVLICREQSRIYMKNHELDFRPGDHLTVSNTRIFANEPQQFSVKFQLYASESSNNNQLDDEDSQLNQINNRNHQTDNEIGTIEVGEMVRLNAVVRPDDGWNYAFLKDIIVSRVSKKRSNLFNNSKGFTTREITTIDSVSDFKQNLYHFSNEKDNVDEPIYGETNLNEIIKAEDQIKLVDENGCRNPTFQLLAPSHPYQLNNNGLDVNFEFKAFIFENMDIKQDRLRISAKIVACQQLDDCKPVNCDDDTKKRKRRWAKDNLMNINNEIITRNNFTENRFKGKLISQQEKQLEFRISKSKNRPKYVLDYTDQQLENDFRSIYVWYSLMAIGLMSIILLSILVYAFRIFF